MGLNTPVIAQTTDNLFGYFGIKAGYSHLFSEKANFSLENKKVAHFSAQNHGTFVVGAVGGFGYKFLPVLGIRTELEYLYRMSANNWNTLQFQEPIEDVQSLRPEHQIHTLLVNAYLDWYVLPQLTIYAGFGVGASITDTSMKYKAQINNDVYEKGHINAPTAGQFAWQAGLGIAYTFNAHWGIDLNARYSDFGKTLCSNKRIQP